MPQRRVLACAIVLIAFVEAGSLGNATPVKTHTPPLIGVVSDDTLSTPFGAIVDVAVTDDGIVHLLDRQNHTVHRVRSTGIYMGVLGRDGEGPGELQHPALLSLYADGRCLVIQDFYARPVCFTPDGRECKSPDISELRAGRFMTIYARAQVDTRDRLLVSSITTRMPTREPNASPEAMGAIAAVVRFDAPEGGTFSDLFTTDTLAGSGTTLLIPWRAQRFVYGCWDVSAAGHLLFADPAGAFRVFVGHPADGESRAIALPWSRDEDRALEELVRQSGANVEPQKVPHILSASWLDDNHFMVQPAIQGALPEQGSVGVFDVFRVTGTRVGRFSVRMQFDQMHDSFFIRRQFLVIIEGGRSAVMASIGGSGVPADVPPARDVETDEVRVRIHELFPMIRAQ